jgi:Ca-activated chloride channel homolog
VVFFSGGSYVLSPGESLAASPENVKRALDTFDHLQGAGGTELLQGLQTAYDLPRADRRIARSVVVVTDGYVAVEAQAFRLVRERLSEASCFAFGIGTSVNRALIEGLARAGQGEPTIVLGPKDAGAAADKLERIIASPVLSQLRYQVEGFEARDVLPGALPDLLAERPVTLLGRYRGAPQGKIVVTGQSAGGAWRRELDLSAAAPRLENSPLRVLWARRWVDLLLDEHHLGPAKELEEAITELGLAHRLLTSFTSFVAIDSEVVNRGGQGETVKQPLPLPEGVSNLAVGGAAPAKQGLAFSRAKGGLAASPHSMPAAPAPVSAQEAEDGLGSGLAEKKERRDEAAARKPAPRIAVLKESMRGLASAASGDALRAAVQARLLELAIQGLRGELELRLTLDGAGVVVKVELVRPADPALRARLEKALRGLQAGAAPADGSASYQLLVRVG